MAGNLSSKNYDTGICEFYVDTTDEIAFLPTTVNKATGSFKFEARFDFFPAVGSTCVVGNEGNMKVYILTSSGWTEI